MRNGFERYMMKASMLSSALGWDATDALFCMYSRKSRVNVFETTPTKYDASLGENSPAEPQVDVAEICIKLDKWMREASADPTAPSPARNTHQDIRDALIDQSLENTIAAFSARWLPVTSSDPQETEYHRTVAQSYWRRARRDMLRVSNRPSYRSMLSLFLFALTPIPFGISEEEETDGISGQACVHAALQQIQTLRARHRNLQFSGSKVSPTLKRSTAAASPESISTSEFITAESIAYWAALTFDTSASLTLNCRPFLSSGLFGFESELPWRLVKSASKMFHETVQGWRGDGTLDMTDQRANEIISSGTGWKLLLWKLTAVFKEALRDGYDETEVEKSYTAVMAAMQEFDDTFRPPLNACQSRMPFLGQQVKLRWCRSRDLCSSDSITTSFTNHLRLDSLMLHYHLSILMLADVIEALDRTDLLNKFAQAISGAEAAVMNTLVFGLQNTFTIGVEWARFDTGYPTNTTASFPILSIDPYPHHVVASVQLMHKAIERDATGGKISDATYSNLMSTLEQVLKNLPANSKSVQAARDRFSLESTAEEIATPHQDLTQYYMLDS